MLPHLQTSKNKFLCNLSDVTSPSDIKEHNSYATCPMLPHLQTSKNKFLCSLSDVTSPSDIKEQIPMQPVRCYLTFRHQRTYSYATCPMLPHLQTSKNKFLCNLSDVTSPSDIKEQIPMQPVRCYLTFRHQRTNSYAACLMLPHLQTSKNKFLCNLSDVTSGV